MNMEYCCHFLHNENKIELEFQMHFIFIKNKKNQEFYQE